MPPNPEPARPCGVPSPPPEGGGGGVEKKTGRVLPRTPPAGAAPPWLERASPTSSSTLSFLGGEKLRAAVACCPAFKVIQIARGLICMAARCAWAGGAQIRSAGPRLRLSSHYHGLP